MRITKLAHSCLLVENNGVEVLFDPGVYSREAIEQANLTQLDYIVVTHLHPDHMDVETIQHLANKFPDVVILAPDDAKEELEAANVTVSDVNEFGDVSLFSSPHESLDPAGKAPDEIGVHFQDLLSVPGDSHSFSETKAILALPIQAPWGSTLNALKLALELKPKHVIPVHDWHWNDNARQQLYDMSERVLRNAGIEFHRPETGREISIELTN